MVHLYSGHIRKHHRPQNTHTVTCFVMTQPPHLEESNILQRRDHLGGDKNWVCPLVPSCYQMGSSAQLQQIICQELAESQLYTEVQGESSKP